MAKQVFFNTIPASALAAAAGVGQANQQGSQQACHFFENEQALDKAREVQPGLYTPGTVSGSLNIPQNDEDMSEEEIEFLNGLMNILGRPNGSIPSDDEIYSLDDVLAKAAG